MQRVWIIWLLVGAAPVAASASDLSIPEGEIVCSESFYRQVEERVPTGDGQGHGPDVGSGEWKSVVEFKLGIRGEPGVPSRDSDAWCRYIGQILQSEAGPSFPCDEVRPGSVEATICGDEELSALDRKLAKVYAAATEIAADQQPPTLKAEQRGWIQGRDECWKSDDQRACVRDEYVRRIAELQARYRLVAFEGPVRLVCDNNPANEVVVTYFETEPPTLIVERGDSVSLMYRQPSESGRRYQGRNESLQDYGDEASIVWGYGAPEMRCKRDSESGK